MTANVVVIKANDVSVYDSNVNVAVASFGSTDGKVVVAIILHVVLFAVVTANLMLLLMLLSILLL